MTNDYFAMVNLIVLSIPVFFSLIALEVTWDRWKGLGLYRLGDTLANIGCGIMDQSSGLFSKVLVVGAYTAVFHSTAHIRSWSMESTLLVWSTAFVMSDLAYYWAHRLSHQVNVLWIGHSVHHQSEDYNLGVALRQSVLQKVLLMWVYWPLAILGFPPEIFLTCMAANLLYQFWIHTELIDRMGPLEWVLNTPSHHRVHHGRNPEYIDRNHAGVFIIWDRMFGTFQQEQVKPTYGVTCPTDSFNPVYAQWKPVADLWKTLRTIPGFLDKVRFLLAPPGWFPDSIGGPQSPPAIVGEEQKFNPRPSGRLAVVLIGRWGMLLGIALLALENKDVISSLELACTLIWVFSALAAVGELWNRGWSRGGLALAWVVDLAFVPVAVLLAGGLGWGYAPKVLLALLSAAATAWALWASKKR
ncbi:sterol desaturase family protein [Flavobacteriales bacterium]|nr:sterol desaturase family protein [Flavobacteriales bacterium]